MDDITLNFGKHNGKKLSEIPQAYVEWLSEQASICGSAAIPQAAKGFLASSSIADRPLRYSKPNTPEEAEKLSWMASKGNKEAARTLLAARDKDGYIVVCGDDADEFLFRVFDNGQGYLAGDRAEVRDNEEQEAKEAKREAEYDANPDLEWTAQTGQRIKIWARDEYGSYEDIDGDAIFTISVDGVKRQRIMDKVPTKRAKWASENGVVAILGNVAITAERKILLDSKVAILKERRCIE